ncbi:MAG TPA: beta-ketoacyl-[acyl-carrier-protein] synthase family protein [Polyangiaceae bacterium]|nr:beta-ketoacyl-[acyl-carrier-protein] synthase family protein [Polyangiaceae bacterium]
MTTARVAVTSVGIVSALGGGASATFERLVRGDRGFSEIDLFDTRGQRTTFAAEVRDFSAKDWALSENRGPLSRSDALAFAAARDALRAADGALFRGRAGVAVGATTGGMFETEERLARFPEAPLSDAAREALVTYPVSSTAERLAAAVGARARVATMCSACSSGASAILQAALWIRSGAVDAALAGGTDALCRLTVTGFNALGATDAVPCRPFDRRRAGLTLGEGAAFLVLESEEAALGRGARVLAWLTGWAAGAEAHHIAQPEPSGRMPARLLAAAIERAGLEPTDVDYLNAHGTGTSNDAVECAAIRSAFGAAADRLLVSSSKGQIGHTLGAAGAIEAAITVLAVERQCVPPTGGLLEPDDACDVTHVIGVGRPARIRAALSSAFGFGGAGTVLLFEEASAPRRTSSVPRGAPRIAVTAAAAVTGRGVLTGTACADALPGDSGDEAPDALASLDPSRSRRFDLQTALVTLAAERALRGAAPEAAPIGLIAGSAFGNVARAASFLRNAFEKGARRAAPAEFPHLLPSSSSGNAAIYLGLTGPVMTASALDASAELSALIACDLLAEDLASAMVAGASLVRDAFSRDVLGPVCHAEAQGRADGSGFVVLEPEQRAKERGARVLAVVVARDEVPLDGERAPSVARPKDLSRAIVVLARDDERARAAIARAGWAGARHVCDSSAAAGAGLAFACGQIERGDADEALVMGFTAARLYALHLARPS